MHLSMTDISRLAANPSPQARAGIAEKVAATLAAGVFTERETTLAVEILRVLARDTEMQVRKAVAEHLQEAAAVPSDLIQSLATDVADVAVPVLQQSHVLTEEELIQIVRSTQEVVKLVAIASRMNVSAELSGALMEKRVREVMKALFTNRGAVVNEEHFMAHWDFIAGEQSLVQVLVSRGGLPVTIAEKLYVIVGDELKQALVKQYHLPPLMAAEAVDDAQEWAMLGVVSTETMTPEAELALEQLVGHLYNSGRLTYSLVIRSLCIGDLSFFESAIARLGNVPRVNARILMFDSGPLGFRAMYDKARLPEGFYDAMQAVLKVSLEETGYGRLKRDDFRRRVVDRIQALGLDRSIVNMQYLLTIIGGSVASAETFH